MKRRPGHKLRAIAEANRYARQAAEFCVTGDTERALIALYQSIALRRFSKFA